MDGNGDFQPFSIQRFGNFAIETSIYKWLALGFQVGMLRLVFGRLQYPLVYPDAQSICIFTYKTE